MSDLYRVVGPRMINGARQGETTTLDPDRVNIPALVTAGHVEPVEDKPSRKKTIKSEGVTGVSIQPDGRDGSGS